jgi:arabinogalactan oligomer / maltooligosaccharide transport system substrate-binding protein
MPPTGRLWYHARGQFCLRQFVSSTVHQYICASVIPSMRHFIPILLIILLAACAAPPPAPTTTPAGTATPVAQAPTLAPRPTRAPPTPAPPTPTPTPARLTLWVAENEAGLAFVSELAAAFSAAGGTPIDVVARDPDTLRLSLAAAELAGEPPPAIIWADQNALVGLVADDRLQPVPVGDATATLPALRTAATYAGRLYGAPVAADGALLLYYNRALVAVPPATSDELIVWARGAATASTAGLVMFWDDVRWLLPWFYAFGGDLAGGDGAQPTLDTPEMVQTLNLMRELYVAAPREGDAYVPGQRRFAAGTAALAVDGSWALSRYRAVSDTLDLGIAPLPRVPATGRPAAPVLNGMYVMIHRDLDAPAVAQAADFITFAQAAEAQERIAAALGRLPAMRSALTSAAVGAEPALAAAAVLAESAPGMPPTLVTRCALFGISVWLPVTLDGRTDLAEAPLRMQREAEACVHGSSR